MNVSCIVEHPHTGVTTPGRDHRRVSPDALEGQPGTGLSLLGLISSMPSRRGLCSTLQRFLLIWLQTNTRRTFFRRPHWREAQSWL
jgi:hypothetical protein